MEGIKDEELRRQILNFLREFKELIGQGDYFVKDHLKNIQTLIMLNINTRNRDEIILSITLEDYSSGPIPDTLHPGHYWIFGKYIADVEIYIKLKIVSTSNGNEKAVCISFHPSEHPLEFPYK